MRLPATVQEIGDFSAFDLGACLPAAASDVWTIWQQRQQSFAVHQHTRSIAFRWPLRPLTAGEAPVMRIERYAGSVLCEAVDRCIGALEAHFGGIGVRAMLAELGPGCEIAPHVDLGPAIDRLHRCHVPVLTNPDVEFVIDGQRHHLRAGIAYDLDNTRTHSVHNRGTSPRVHLICDILMS